MGALFNVEAYENREFVTLIDGQIAVKNSEKPGFDIKMNAGQQASIYESSLVVSEPQNISNISAWTNGIFQFQNTSMYEVLKEKEIEQGYWSTEKYETPTQQRFIG